MLEARLQLTLGSFSLDLGLAATPGVLAVVGPNGAGKTTLLHALLGAHRPAQGRITLFGRVLFDAEGSVDVPIELRGLGYVPQDYALFGHMTAADNVAFALPRARRPSRAAAVARARALLDEQRLSHLANKKPEALSSGERQRIALVRALAAEPKALLLDEPLAALDTSAREHVRKMLAAYLHAHPIPTLLVTHDPDDARALADEVLVIESGKVVQRGTWASLVSDPKSEHVRRLVQRARGACDARDGRDESGGNSSGTAAPHSSTS